MKLIENPQPNDESDIKNNSNVNDSTLEFSENCSSKKKKRTKRKIYPRLNEWSTTAYSPSDRSLDTGIARSFEEYDMPELKNKWADWKEMETIDTSRQVSNNYISPYQYFNQAADTMKAYQNMDANPFVIANLYRAETEIPFQYSNVIQLQDALIISEQPAHFARFRYGSEGRERPLEGERTFPEVAINPKYINLLQNNAVVHASLTTRSGSSHWHELVGSTILPISQENPRVKFNSLSIVMAKRTIQEYPRNKDDQRIVRIKFTLQFGDKKTLYLAEALSQPIFNAKLAISKISHSHGPAVGGNEVIILCSKIRKATTAVRLVEDNPHNSSCSQFDTTSDVKWVKQEKEGFYYIDLLPNKLQFHHQYAIVTKIPPYYDQNISSIAQVRVHLLDIEDKTESPSVSYGYIPNDI